MILSVTVAQELLSVYGNDLRAFLDIVRDEVFFEHPDFVRGWNSWGERLTYLIFRDGSCLAWDGVTFYEVNRDGCND